MTPSTPRLPRWAHRHLPPPPLRCALKSAPLRGRAPPVDYRDKLHLSQPVQYVPEHLSTMSPAFTPNGAERSH